MKRLNRKKIIQQFEELRQGFADAIMVAERHKDVVALVTFKANHHNADTVIVSLGGESVIE